MTVRSRSLTRTRSVFVAHSSTMPNMSSGLQRTKRNSVPSTVRGRIAFGDVTNTASCGCVTIWCRSIAEACET